MPLLENQEYHGGLTVLSQRKALVFFFAIGMPRLAKTAQSGAEILPNPNAAFSSCRSMRVASMRVAPAVMKSVTRAKQGNGTIGRWRDKRCSWQTRATESKWLQPRGAQGNESDDKDITNSGRRLLS